MDIILFIVAVAVIAGVVLYARKGKSPFKRDASDRKDRQ